ncbi:MAG: EamA family transporter [Cyanothece sp. SIO1E1]|nr:EamA family transporter [Cyanothece sp. SIO1E1]
MIIQKKRTSISWLTPGVRLMLLATFGFTIMQVFVKQLADFHVSQIVFFRSSITALFCLTLLRQKGVSILGKNRKLLVLRSICGIIAMTLFFITVQRMPLGASLSLKYLSPIFTAVFAVLLINEKVKPIQWLFFLTALAGVFLLKGFDTRIDLISLIMGIVGAIFGGLVYVVIRKIGHTEHPLVIVNYFMLSATLLSGITMIFFWQNPKPLEWGLLFGMGFFGYLGQLYMTRAFQAEAASRVAPVKYIEVVYSLVIGFLWFGESYSILAFAGILLILLSMILNLNFRSK